MGLFVTKGEHPHSKTLTEVLRQTSKRGRKESIYLYNIPECIMALSILFIKKKRVLHLSEAGERKRKRRGEERAGGYEPSPVVFTGPPIPSFPFARYGEIRFFERNEVIGREDGWREISTHKTPFTSKGKTKVRSCAPAEERSFGEAYLN